MNGTTGQKYVVATTTNGPTISSSTDSGNMLIFWFCRKELYDISNFNPLLLDQGGPCIKPILIENSAVNELFICVAISMSKSRHCPAMFTGRLELDTGTSCQFSDRQRN